VTGVRALLACAAVSLCFAAAAHAEQVSEQQFGSLVDDAAAGDRQALERLRSVDNVDGRPVDMRRALDADGAELKNRLDALDQGGGAAGAPGKPSEQAKEILDGSDYKSPDPPRPFRKPLQRIGDWINDAISSVTFGNSPIGWFVFALLVAALVGVAAVLLSRNRLKGSAGHKGEQDLETGENPAELEHRADRAEKAGDYSLAVRLRYRAGVLRLGDRKAIDYRPSLTVHQVSDQLHSERYDELATRFEGIAYGEQEATQQDSADAAADWREVVKEPRK
jgi:hypothetical protein